MVGRLGGVGVLWRKSLGNNIKLCGSDLDGRVVAIGIRNQGNMTLCFGVYFPYDDHSSEYLLRVDSVIGFINSVCDRFSDCKMMLVGDFNFECVSRCKGFVSFEKFAARCDLIVCDELDVNKVGYSYFHESLNHRSLIDHVFVPSSLKACVSKYCILDEGENNSDHLPIVFVLGCTLSGVMGSSRNVDK